MSASECGRPRDEQRSRDSSQALVTSGHIRNSPIIRKFIRLPNLPGYKVQSSQTISEFALMARNLDVDGEVTDSALTETARGM